MQQSCLLYSLIVAKNMLKATNTPQKPRTCTTYTEDTTETMGMKDTTGTEDTTDTGYEASLSACEPTCLWTGTQTGCVGRCYTYIMRALSLCAMRPVHGAL